MRHLSLAEKQAIVAIVDAAGLPEVVRLLSALVQQRTENLQDANVLSSQLLLVANVLAGNRPCPKK